MCRWHFPCQITLLCHSRYALPDGRGPFMLAGAITVDNKRRVFDLRSYPNPACHSVQVLLPVADGLAWDPCTPEPHSDSRTRGDCDKEIPDAVKCSCKHPQSVAPGNLWHCIVQFKPSSLRFLTRCPRTPPRPGDPTLQEMSASCTPFLDRDFCRHICWQQRTGFSREA